MATIYQNMDLGVLETRIGEALERCTIWGDLSLSNEEYDILNEKISSFLNTKDNRYSGFIQFSHTYPKIAVTQIINFALYEYDGSFWTPWSARFGLELDQFEQSHVGNLIKNIMKKNGFERWEDDGYKNVTPIICQAGIPTPSYDEIFDIIEGTLNDFYFSPADLLSEINSGRYYHIEKGPERFFRLYPEKSVDLLNSIRVLLQTLEDPAMSLERAVSVYTDLSPRIMERYLKWLNEDSYNTSSRRSKVHYAPPRLCFSDDGKGVSIFLPEEIIRDEYIYKVCWKIFYDNNDEPNHSSIQQVLMSDRSSYIDSLYIAVDFAEEYRVELWGDNDDQPIYSLNIDGFCNKDYLLFDSNGRIAKSDNLSFTGTSTIILAPETTIIESKDINLYPFRLPKRWGSLEAFTIAPAEKDSFILIGSGSRNYKLTVKYSYDIQLISLGNLFREEYTDKSLPVYTRWPALQIGSKDDKIEDIENWEIRLRSISTGEQITYHNRDFTNSEEGYYNIEAVASSLVAASNGKYEIKVYRGREFKKSFLFYKAPYIESDDSIKMEWPSKFSNVETTGFQFLDNPDDYEIQFKTNVRIEKLQARGRTWNQITTYEPGTKIEGVLYLKEGGVIEIPFQKTVRKMKWSFWNETNNEEVHCRGTKTFTFNDLQKGVWWLSLYLSGTVAPGSIMEIVLQTRNRHPLQKIDVKLNDVGNFTIPLGSFQSTFENYNSTSLSLMFHFIAGEVEDEDKDEHWISLAEIKDEAILKNSNYQLTAAGQPVIIWDETDRIDSESLQIISLSDPGCVSIENLKNLKCNQSHRQYIKLEKSLRPGAYMIKPYENVDSFLIDESDDDNNTIFEYDPLKLIYVDKNTFTLDKAITLFDWMILVVMHLGNYNNISLIEKRLAKSQITIGDDIEKAGAIIFSLIINIKKDIFSQEIKEKLISILEFIIHSCLGNKERGKLITILLNCRMNQEDKETIINRMGLYRFSATAGSLNAKEIRDLWDLDRFLASLWIMKSASVDKSNVDRLINLIGIDFFKDATILTGQNSDEADWLQSLKSVLTGAGTDISIHLQSSKDIWGNTQELINMIDFGNRPGSKIVLDTKKRSTKGKLFAGSRYLDLLIEWYRDTAFKDEVNSEIKEVAKQAEIAEQSLKHFEGIEQIYQNFGRILDNRQANEAARYRICYYCALFALTESFLADSKDYNEISISLNILAKRVSDLIPAIYKRDLLMAELYAFLIRERGANLCQ